jgi:gliding motility-associated-like protein
MWFLFTGADKDSVAVLPGGSVVVNYSSPGTYPIKMIVQQAGKADTLDSVGVVVIKPLPSIKLENLIGNDKVCQNYEAEYTITNVDAGASYQWSFNGATEQAGSTNINKKLKFGPSSQDVTIKVIEDRDGCVDSIMKVVDVLPSPTIKAIQGVKAVCENEPLTLSLAGAPSTSTYVWTPSANITAYNADKTEATFLFPEAGEYPITVLETDVNGCSSLDSTSKATVRVKDIPTAPSIISSAGICEGANAEFSAILNNAFTYNWKVISPDQIVSQDVNKVVVKPIGTGTKTVSLSVTQEGCTSEEVSATYQVEANPGAPVIIPAASLFCEGQEVEYSIQSPVSTSKYCWTIPDGASVVSGESGCPVTKLNDKITIKFGANGGQIKASETTSLGCKSTVEGSASATVQKALGAFEIFKEFEGEICASSSYDSLAQYEVRVGNATSISYFVSPVNTQTFTQSGSGNAKSLDVVFAQAGNYEIKAVADGGICFKDSITWNVNVKESVPVSLSIDNGDVCDGDDVEYTVTLIPNSDAGAKFKWYLNNKFEVTGNKIKINNVNTGDELKVEYERGEGFCPDIANSQFTKVEKLKVWDSPDLDFIITGTEVEEKFDEDGLYYQIKDNKSIINLEGTLNSNPLEGSIYNYTFYWKDGANKSFSNINVPVGTITDFAQTPANLGDLLNSQRDRVYVFEVNLNGICPAMIEARVNVNYDVDIPDAVCYTCGTGNWTIKNIEKFPGNTVVIFNRWGTVVRTFAAGEFNSSGWDGTSDSGEQLPVGTYFYTVVLSPEANPCTGPLTLLR